MRTTESLWVSALAFVALAAHAREAVKVEAGFLASLKRAAKEDGEQASAMLKAAEGMVQANAAKEPPARVSRRIAELKSRAKGEKRLKAIRDLARLGEPALFALSELLLSGDADAASAIASVGSKSGTLALVQGLRGGTWKVRLASARALAVLSDAHALPFLREAQARVEKTARAGRMEEADFAFECEDAIGAIERENLPPEKKKLEETLDALESRLCEASFTDDFARSAAGAKKILPRAIALAQAHPESERVRELVEQVRRLIMSDGADVLLNEIEEEGVDELEKLGVEVVAWLERSSLRVAVANFGEKRSVSVKLGFFSGTRGGGGGDEIFLETSSAELKLGRGEARLVRFTGIPKPPPDKKGKWVDDQPSCVVATEAEGKRLTARLLPQGYSEESIAWDCREYVVRGDSVSIDFHMRKGMLVHVQKRFVSRQGREFLSEIKGKGRIREAEHGWFADGVGFTVTLSFKGLKRPDVVWMRDVFARIWEGHMGYEVVSRGPRILALSHNARVRTINRELPAAKRIDAAPLSDDPKKRAEELAMRVRRPVWNVSREAVEELVKLGEAAVDVLSDLSAEHLGSELDQRIKRALAGMEGQGAMEELLRRLGDEHWSKGRDAASALAQMGEAAVEPLLKVLREGNANARCSALIALGRIGSKHPSDRIAEAAKACLDDPDKRVRQRTAEALAAIKPPGALEALARRLGKEPDENVRSRVAIALGMMGDRSAAAPLIERLEAPEETDDVKETILSVLGELRAKEATPACARVLESASPKLRKSALWAMRHFADERAADALIAQLDDMDAEIRWAAARVLGRTGARKAIDPLLEALADEDETVRSYAARSLRKLGVEVEERGHEMYFVPEPPRRLRRAMRRKRPAALVEAFAHEDWQTRRCSLEEVVRRKKAAIPHLLKAAADGRAQVRLCAVQALLRIGGKEARACAAGLLDDADVQVRRKAAELLVETKDPSLKDAWLRANAGKDWFVRARAAEALGAFGGAGIAADLRKAVFDQRKEARIRAIEALGKMRDAEAAPLLAEALWGKTERAKKLYGYKDYRPKVHGQVLAIKNVLIAIGEPAVEHVIPLLDSRWGDRERLAEEILLEIGEAARPALVQAARTGRKFIASRAAVVLGRMKIEGTAELFFELVERGKGWGGEDALIKMGDAAKAELLGFLKDGTEKQRLAAAYVLAKLGDRSGIDTMVEVLASEDPYMRLRAGDRLTEVGTEAEVPALIEAAAARDCPGSVFSALRKIGDKRAIPALKSALLRPQDWVGSRSARALFEMTGEAHRYLDRNGRLQTWGKRDPLARTAVEAGLVGGKPKIRFDFEDGTAMGWERGQPAQEPARGKFALMAPPSETWLRLASPELSHTVGEDSWLSMRVYVPRRMSIHVLLKSEKAGAFIAQPSFDGEGWEGFACQLVGLRGARGYAARSKPGDTLNLIQIRSSYRQAGAIVFYIDDVLIVGGEGGVAEPEEPQDEF